MAKLVTRFVMVIMICDPVDTAETSAEQANLPTISKSTAPYIDCRNIAKNTGTIKRISGERIFPSVKFLS